MERPTPTAKSRLPWRPEGPRTRVRTRMRTLRSIPVARLLTTTAAAFVLAWQSAGAQSYTHGQNVSPAFEGWEEDADGSKYFLFGYMNRNWTEELDVAV